MINEGIVTLPEAAPIDERTLGRKFMDANAQLGKELADGFNKMSGSVVSGCKHVAAAMSAKL